MPVQYKYRAVTDAGERREGKISAQNHEQVEEYLAEQKLRPVRIEVSRPAGQNIWNFFRKTDYEKLIMFTTSLATMYKAGIPLLRALGIVRIGPADGRFNQVIHELRAAIESGRQLSEGMREYPDIFTNVYIACIASGEESGKLENTLDELALMLEAEMEINRQVKTALRYPAIVMIVITIAIGVLMTFVVPRFVDFYAAFGAELPLPTKILMGTALFFERFWYLLLIGFGLGLYGFRKFLERPGGRFWFDLQLLKIPVLGELLVKGNIARFCLMFRLMFRAGLPLVKCLQTLGDTIKNTVLRQEVSHLEDFFRRGKELETVTGSFKWFPEQALYMMAIGLESGNLDDMLREIGIHYSRQVSYTSRQLTTIIEPVLTIALGVCVLVMALAIFLPMWNLIKVLNPH